jgi:hypothetical protein
MQAEFTATVPLRWLTVAQEQPGQIWLQLTESQRVKALALLREVAVRQLRPLIFCAP